MKYEDIFDEEATMEADIEELRGTISEGSCLFCNKGRMKYTAEVCFICDKCGKSVHEDIYYQWAAGYPVEFIDET